MTLLRNPKRSMLHACCTLAILWFFAPPAVSGAAGCAWTRSPEQPTDWNSFYDGKVLSGSEITIRAALSFDNCIIRGSWIDSVSFEDLEIDGVMADDGAATLTLRSGSGAVKAIVRGRFFSYDFLIHDDSSPKDVSTLQNFFGQIGSPPLGDSIGNIVELQLQKFGPGNGAEFDPDSGVRDLAAFHLATLRFWRAVRDHDVRVVSQCVQYPLRTDVYDPRTQKTREIIIRNAQMLERNYDAVFNWKRRYDIMMRLPRNLDQGYFVNTYSLGGVVLFNSKGVVIGLPFEYRDPATPEIPSPAARK